MKDRIFRISEKSQTKEMFFEGRQCCALTCKWQDVS